jgi:hypothetical protein
MSPTQPEPGPLRLDPVSYETLRQQVLRRDGWRCQSCGTMSSLEIHHKQFRNGDFTSTMPQAAARNRNTPIPILRLPRSSRRGYVGQFGR